MMNRKDHLYNVKSLKRHNHYGTCGRIVRSCGKYICILLCLFSPISFTGGLLHTVALASSPSFSNSNCNRQLNSGISRTAAGYSSLSGSSVESASKCAENSKSALFASLKNEKNESKHAGSKLQKYFHLFPLKKFFRGVSNPLFKSHNFEVSRRDDSHLNMLSISSDTTINKSNLSEDSIDLMRNNSDFKINGDPDYWWKYGEHQSSFLSRLTYHYTTPLLKKAQTQRLELSDAFQLPKSELMNNTVENLWNIYTDEKRNAEHNERTTGITTSHSVILTKSLLLSQKKTLIITGLLRLLNTLIQAFPAILVSRLLRTIEESAPPSKSIAAAGTLVAILSLKMIVENLYFHKVVKMSTSIRGAISGVIFDKSLRLPGGGESDTVVARKSKSKKSKRKNKNKSLGVGGVLNLMQTDASMLESVALQIHTIWDGPLQIAIYTSLLFKYLGPSVFWGIGVLLVTIPINSITLRILNRLNRKENEAKDARTKRTVEALSNMKLLKLQTWEKYFAEDINKHRETELNRRITRGTVRAMSTAISNAVPAIILVVTLMAYTRTGRPLVASTIFTAISLFNQLRFPLLFYPMLIDSLANGKNSLRRISDFLKTEEVVEYVTRIDSTKNSGGGLRLTNGNFLWNGGNGGIGGSSWNPDDQKKKPQTPALCDADVDIKPGEVIAVVGSVGSGKTALIKALLGELSPAPRIAVDEAKNNANNELKNDDTVISDIPTVVCTGPVSYCAQEPWLAKGSIRDSIVFGREFDIKRYEDAIWDAGLDRDIFDEGTAPSGMLTHDTDVGEGGSSLSGGQRARVALARALYGQSENLGGGVYLLDDPLAALDASVGSIVFERLLARFKRENAAVVFVTNDPSLPRRCDRVILMGKLSNSNEAGCSRILDYGKYDDLIYRGYDLKNLVELEEYEEDNNDLDAEMNDNIPATHNIELSQTNNIKILDEDGQDSIQSTTDYAGLINMTLTKPHADLNRDEYSEHDDSPKSTEFILKDEDPTSTDLITMNSQKIDGNESKNFESNPTILPVLSSADDFMEKGAVPKETYISYFRAINKPLLVAGMVCSFLMVNSAQFYQSFIVAKWTEMSQANSIGFALQAKYMASLVKAAGVVSIFLFARSYLTMRVGIRASSSIHASMLKSVFAAPMSFFDATPSGQLLSRFGKELDIIDRSLPDGISSVLFCFLQILFSCTALFGVITPGLIFPLIGTALLYARVMRRFRPAARDMKRAESKSRAPIYTHFSEALRGAETIRSIPSGSNTWSKQHKGFTDDNLSVFYSVKSFDRRLSVQLESLGNGVVLMCAVVSIFLSKAGRLKPGNAGWGLTQALSITGLLTWAVRCLTDLESQMMSVSRVNEITDIESTSISASPDDVDARQKITKKMPRELDGVGEALFGTINKEKIKILSTPKNDIALSQTGWPWRGDVRFNGVSMRYNSLSPLVLKNISFHVPPGSTLGVVGRTGSGKSSLLLTLFRLVEIENDEHSSIEIDGVDIRSVGLQTLRKKLSIIPQDPVLFTGTVMYNLDATLQCSEEDAWKALYAASPDLANKFKNEGTGLQTKISEGGKNLSLGQRQLICLARALLRRSKILVLDEATSSVDSFTDAQVQATIRREFVEKGVTVITVAHRLETVMGYDKICVLGNGSIIEYGAPSELLKIENGELKRLVNANLMNKKKGSKILETTMKKPVNVI